MSGGGTAAGGGKGGSMPTAASGNQSVGGGMMQILQQLTGQQGQGAPVVQQPRPAGTQQGAPVVQQPRPAGAQQPQQASQQMAAQAQGQQGFGVNPMTNAANGMQDMFQALQQAHGNINSYSPVTGQAQGYTAAQQQAPQDIRSLMGNYQNPYENEVVRRTTSNMQRTTQMQQEQNAASAAAAGAFGGGRHGVVEALTNAEGQRNIGDMTAQLRQQGFDTSASLAGQDVANRMSVGRDNQGALNQQRQFNTGNRQDMQQFNALGRERMQTGRTQDLMSLAQGLGNASAQSFGMGNTLNQQQGAAGAQQQALMQSILGGSNALFDQYMSNPQQLLQMRLAAAGMSPLNGATTTTGTQTTPNTLPGNLLGAAGNMFEFAPMKFPFSAARFKHDVRATGRKVRSVAGNVTDEVTFRYLPEMDPSQTCYTGIVAEGLPANDPAIYTNAAGQHERVDYSKLEVVA